MSDDETLNQILRAWDPGPYAGPHRTAEPPTKVMHLPAGAPAPDREIPARAPKWPYLKTIIALVVVDVALWTVAVMYWLIDWEDIWA